MEERKLFKEEDFTEEELVLLKTIFKMGYSMAEGLRNSDYCVDSMSDTIFGLIQKLGLDKIIYGSY